MKKLLFKKTSNGNHWVGDGFPVRNIFGYNDIAKDISPFLLMDYAGPYDFPASQNGKLRGVEKHPHRGFETVTIVYHGEVEHKDSAGGGGKIGPGDVQWMTAAAGLIHEEYHGESYSKKGGPFEMVQLWVNLPAKDKMNQPRYQAISDKSIPVVELPHEVGRVRIIAGLYENQTGPALTHTPINLWDLRLGKKGMVSLKVPANQTTSLFVLSGAIKISDEMIQEAELAVLDTQDDEIQFEVLEESKLLFLGGAPLNEPIVGYGPFVMNHQREIQQAMIDYQNGKMGPI